jgi:hypothetical protein
VHANAGFLSRRLAKHQKHSRTKGKLQPPQMAAVADKRSGSYSRLGTNTGEVASGIGS